MQQVGSAILSVHLSNFENVINRKDLIIKSLLSKLEKTEQENRDLKTVLNNLGLFLQDLSKDSNKLGG
jgi:hypothetical protein